FMVLRWTDEQGQLQTRYYDGAGSRGDGTGETLAGDFMAHAKGAIAPAWQVATTLAHWQQGQGIQLPKADQGLPQGTGDGIHQALQAITLALPQTLPTEPALQTTLTDIDGDGYLEQSQWLANNQAMLAIDANGNGRIDAGELIQLSGAGLNALSWLDATHDGKITASDPAFSALRLWIDINSDGNSTNTTSATSATSATNTTNAAASETQTLAQAGIIAIDFTSNPPHIIKADGSTTQLTVQTLTANILGTQYQNVQGGVLQQDEQRNADGTLAAPVQTLHAVNTRQFDGQAAHIRGGVVASATPGQSQSTVDAGDARVSTTTSKTINNQSTQSSTTVNAGDARLQNGQAGNTQTGQTTQTTQAAQIRSNALAFVPLGSLSAAQEQRQATEAMIRSAGSSLVDAAGGALPLAAIAVGAAAVQWPTVSHAASANAAGTASSMGPQARHDDSGSNARPINDSPVFESSVIAGLSRDPVGGLNTNTNANASNSSNSSSTPNRLDTPVQGQFEAPKEQLAQQNRGQAATNSIATQSVSNRSTNSSSNILSSQARSDNNNDNNDNNNDNSNDSSSQASTLTSLTTFTNSAGILFAYPRAVGETAAGDEDTPLRFAQSVLLANDSTDNAPSRLGEPALSITAVYAPTHGSVSLQTGADGLAEVVFKPDANYHGPASFGYTVTDQYGLSSQASTTLDIAAVNDAPVAVGETATGDEDNTLYFSPASLLANDSDVDTVTDGQVLSISAVFGATHGIAGIGADGRVFFTPDVDYFGPASFNYRVSDGTGLANGISNATVTLTINPVNDAPVALGESTQTLEDTQLSINPASLLANDRDVDDPQSSLTLSLTLAQVANASHGTVALVTQTDAQGNPIPGGQRVIFTPHANYHGPASFDYTVSDPHGASSTATASITIAAVNDAPVTQDETATGDEDNTLKFTAASLLANDSDVDTAVDGDVLTITRVGSAQHGQVFLAADGTVSFTPDANYNGPAQFSYWVGDRTAAQLISAGNGGDGYETQATMRLTILPVNDLPVVTGESISSDEDIVLDINPALLLANDADVDTATNGQTLSISAVSNAQHGTITRLPNGHLQFTPEQDYFGAAGFSYTVNDGVGGLVQGHVVVNLAPVNDAPKVLGETITFAEDNIQTISQASLLANDSDVDNPNSDLRIIAVGNATHGTISLNLDGSIRFAPDADYFGPAQFTYTVSDRTTGLNSFSIGTATLDITPVNDAPRVVGESLTLDEDTQARFSIASLLANDTDVDNAHSDLTIIAATIDPASAANGSVSISNGQIVFTPTLNFNGQASFRYTVSDGVGGTSQASVSLSFNPINDAPVANGELVFGKKDVGYTLTQAALLANDTDVETPGNLRISSITNVQHGTATLNTDGSVRFTPTPGYAGRGSFDYAVTDRDGASSTATAQIDFSRINTSPITTDDSFTGYEDIPLSITAAQLLVNDRDDDNAMADLRVVAVNGATNGTVSLQSDGSVRFLGNQDFYGTASFNYQVSDGDGGLTWARASLTLQSVNDAPVIEDIWYGRPIYGTQTVGVDESGNPITRSITDPGLALSLYNSGQLAGSLYRNGQVRPVSFDYADALVGDESGTNTDDPYRQNGKLIAYDVDGDSSAISFGIAASPQHGHAWANQYTSYSAPRNIDHTQAGAYWVAETGSWQYYSQRGDGYSGGDSFTMRATDSGGAFVDRVIGVTHTGSPAAGGGGKKPVTLDLDGNGLHYIGLDDSQAYFDVNNDGWREHLAWVSAGDALLVLDKGGDKVIDRFDEISFTGYLPGARTDLEGLAAFDSNGDGLLSRLDTRWREFAVWQDADGNGLSMASEVHTLDEVGITQISLISDHQRREVDGVVEFGQARFTWADGTTGAVGDVALPVAATVHAAAPPAVQPRLTPEHAALLMVQMISTVTAAQDIEPLVVVPMSDALEPQHALLATQTDWQQTGQAAQLQTA
ncbi:MAG: cadherin-like domain-containing protein, partial [Polaromonas sp.]